MEFLLWIALVVSLMNLSRNEIFQMICLSSSLDELVSCRILAMNHVSFCLDDIIDLWDFSDKLPL